MTTLERSQIKDLLSDPRWAAVIEAVDELKQANQEDTIRGDTEFDTTCRAVMHDMWNLIPTAIFQKLDREASQANTNEQ